MVLFPYDFPLPDSILPHLRTVPDDPQPILRVNKNMPVKATICQVESYLITTYIITGNIVRGAHPQIALIVEQKIFHEGVFQAFEDGRQIVKGCLFGIIVKVVLLIRQPYSVVCIDETDISIPLQLLLHMDTCQHPSSHIVTVHSLTRNTYQHEVLPIRKHEVYFFVLCSLHKVSR